MKVLKSFAVFCALLSAGLCLAGCNVPPSDGGDAENPQYTVSVQELDYTESLEKTDNPDRGFYRPISVRLTPDGAIYNKNIVSETTQIYHLRTDISAFSTSAGGQDGALSQNALTGLRELFGYLNERSKSAVFRMAYDPNYGGKSNCEPSLTVMSEHISQVSEVLNEFPQTVTAVEVGMIGPWGEMHTSEAAKPSVITALAKQYLEKTENLPILLRTPKMIYDFLGITVNDIDGWKISPTDPAYRLGVFNDGYLGSANDLGTYSDRERETEFLSGQNAHLPYGGEVVIPTSPLHDIQNCTDEMFKLSLSYLNIEWNNSVIDKWKNSFYTADCGSEENYYGKTAFEYITNRMGYRFVLKESAFRYSDGRLAGISLNFKNVGFGNLNKQKHVKLIICESEGSVYREFDLKDFDGSESYVEDVNFKDVGEYKAYLCIYGSTLKGAPNYAVKLANPNIFNDNLYANYIGAIKNL